jgi:hypothetical protein
LRRDSPEHHGGLVVVPLREGSGGWHEAAGHPTRRQERLARVLDASSLDEGGADLSVGFSAPSLEAGGHGAEVELSQESGHRRRGLAGGAEGEVE